LAASIPTTIRFYDLPNSSAKQHELSGSISNRNEYEDWAIFPTCNDGNR
jgi:hypothetical protein